MENKMDFKTFAIYIIFTQDGITHPNTFQGMMAFTLIESFSKIFKSEALTEEDDPLFFTTNIMFELYNMGLLIPTKPIFIPQKNLDRIKKMPFEQEDFSEITKQLLIELKVPSKNALKYFSNI